MKQFAWTMAALALVAILLAVPVMTRRTSSAPDCAGRVVIMKGPDGEPVECVCVGGTLATCFKPGP